MTKPIPLDFKLLMVRLENAEHQITILKKENLAQHNAILSSISISVRHTREITDLKKTLERVEDYQDKIVEWGHFY